MSRPGFLELHPVSWAEIVQASATTRRLADDLFDVQIEKSRLSVEAHVEPYPTPAISTTFWLRGIAARELSIAQDGETVVDVRVTLTQPMPDVSFRPDPLLALPHGISFDDAVEIVECRELPIYVNGIVEGRDYWFFPRFHSASCGLFVAKEDGAVTDAGSAFPPEDWLWGYDHGLVTTANVDLCITRVFDLALARRLLKEHFGLRPSHELMLGLERPPLVIARAVNWRAIRWLRYTAGAAFAWYVRKPEAQLAAPRIEDLRDRAGRR